jgi:hypothetical protein
MGAQGTAIIDFGASPGVAGPVSIAVTGQGSILTSSACEAWVRVQDATAAHNTDEHIVENLKVEAGNIVAATGFTIYVVCTVGNAYGTFNLNWCWN